MISPKESFAMTVNTRFVIAVPHIASQFGAKCRSRPASKAFGLLGLCLNAGANRRFVLLTTDNEQHERSSSVGLKNVVNAATAASAVAESSSHEKSRYRQYVSYFSAVSHSNCDNSSKNCNKQALDNHIVDHAVAAGIPTILPLSA